MDSEFNPDTAPASSQPTTYVAGVTPPEPAAPPSTDTWTSGSHLDSQSRNNLRQASVALDTAYERITSLRNSINDMLNRIPPEVAGPTASTTRTDTSAAQPTPSHDASMRPSHSALVLSSEQVVEELNLRAARLRSLISPSARQRLEEFESGSRSDVRREPTWDRPRLDRGDLHPAPPRSRSPPMPDLILPRAAQRRDLQSANRDDSSTMIGRRVAARVNAPDGPGNLSSRLSLSQIEQRLQAQTAQIARELENMTDRLAAQRSRRAELAPSGVRGDAAAVVVPGPSQVTASSDSRSVPSPPVGGRPPRSPREAVLVDNIARIVLPQPISRTSLDGVPIDEFMTPPRRGLPATFREHITVYRDHVQIGNAPQDASRNPANTPEVRGALINLLARDRDEQVLSARQTEHVRPGVDTGRRDDASGRSNPSSPAGQGRRRRGWTRLNADGDEIDSDEDDNVSPHTRRLRMRFAYGAPNVDQSATRSHTVTIEDILWRTSGSDSEPDALSPDLTDSCSPLFQYSPPQPPVRCPHPLPTPVEDMLVYPAAKAPQQSRAVCVSKYASLAGR